MDAPAITNRPTGSRLHALSFAITPSTLHVYFFPRNSIVYRIRTKIHWTRTHLHQGISPFFVVVVVVLLVSKTQDRGIGYFHCVPSCNYHSWLCDGIQDILTASCAQNGGCGNRSRLRLWNCFVDERKHRLPTAGDRSRVFCLTAMARSTLSDLEGLQSSFNISTAICSALEQVTRSRLLCVHAIVKPHGPPLWTERRRRKVYEINEMEEIPAARGKLHSCYCLQRKRRSA